MLGRDSDGFPLPLGPDSLLGLVGTSRPSSSLPGGVQHQQCPGVSCSLTVHCSQGWDGLVGLILPKSFHQLAGEQGTKCTLAGQHALQTITLGRRAQAQQHSGRGKSSAGALP